MKKEDVKKLADEGYITDSTIFTVSDDKFNAIAADEASLINYKLVTQVAKAEEMMNSESAPSGDSESKDPVPEPEKKPAVPEETPVDKEKVPDQESATKEEVTVEEPAVHKKTNSKK